MNIILQLYQDKWLAINSEGSMTILPTKNNYRSLQLPRNARHEAELTSNSN